MKFKNVIYTLLVVLLALTGCSDEDCGLRHSDSLLGLPALKQGTFPESDMNLKIGEIYEYAPVVSSPGDVYYQWYAGDDDLGTESRLTFKAEQPSRTKISLALTNDYGKVELENRIIVSGADYSGGCLVVNEGWYGHESGSISHYNYTTKTMEHWAYKAQNFGATLGRTTQSATLWKGKLYICSKELEHLTIVDPKTLYMEKSGNVLPGHIQAHEFIGLNEQYGILTASGDIFRVDLNTFEAEKITTGNTWGGCGGGIIYQGKLLLNVKGQNVYVLDTDKLSGDLSQYNYKNPFPYTTLEIRTSGISRFVEGKDGNVYTIESTGSTNNLVRIKPDLLIEKSPMRTDYVPASFGSYREAMFCGTGDTFFYVAGNKIYKATFEQAAPATPFITYGKDSYSFYGAGIRINRAGNELVATYVIPNQYEKNLIARFNTTTGENISELTYEGYYFPGTIIFNEQ